MTSLCRLAALLLPLALGACSMNAPHPAPTNSVAIPPALEVSPNPGGGAMLLVSLDDGTVIKQVIDIHADICFKQNSSSSTTCFTQSEPIVDATTNTIIGFEMIEDRIDLVAKSD